MSFLEFMDVEKAKKILSEGSGIALTDERVMAAMQALREALEEDPSLPLERLYEILENGTNISIALEGISADDVKMLHVLARKRLWQS